jgi:hypothetical protein
MNVVTAVSILDEIHTTGHSPLKVLGDDGKIYIVKTRKHIGPDTEILSEFICNFLCNHWGINTPVCSFIKVPDTLIKEAKFLSNRHKVGLYENYVCFGSQFMDNAIDIENNDLTFTKNNQVHFNDMNQILKIGLFDLWIVNIDRKPTNLNLMKTIGPNGKFDFVAIDHAYAFDTLLYDQLSPHSELSYNESLLFMDVVRQIVKSNNNPFLMDEYREYFYHSIALCVVDCHRFFSGLTDNFKAESQFFPYIKRFLFNEDRNGIIFADFITRIR